MAGGLEPATIINTLTNDTVKCMFRPKEYTASKQNTWNKNTKTGKNVAKPNFGGGNPITLQMELFFDTYEAHEDFGNSAGQDVREWTDKIWKLMFTTASPKKNGATGRGEPPVVEFRWGKTWHFKAVIQQISQKFTMFLEDGTPVRSTMNVTLMQAEADDDRPFQNPTSGTPAGFRRRVVVDGDSLDLIAHQEYGDARAWRRLAEVNNLDDPRHLRAGQVLAIVPDL